MGKKVSHVTPRQTLNFTCQVRESSIHRPKVWNSKRGRMKFGDKVARSVNMVDMCVWDPLPITVILMCYISYMYLVYLAYNFTINT